ncbi:MAG: phosphotransferase [Mycoplasma sp.]|nr:phosphotransferase [Mycoplasma sp.]
MNETVKRKLTGGFKNDTYKITKDKIDFFYKEKKFDSFNHKINYDLITDFDFVPKLIYQDKKIYKSEWINGNNPNLKDDDELIQVANILKTIHNSKKKFPKSNHKKRVIKYFGELNKNKKGPKEVYKYFKKAKEISKKIKNVSPLHNDPWINNLIKDKNKKIWLIDWEYATMGDKHFDLAMFIDGSWLNKKQETIFLNEYNDYIPKQLKEMKFFVNYLTLVWMHSLEKLPFKDNEIIKKIKQLDKEI